MVFDFVSHLEMFLTLFIVHALIRTNRLNFDISGVRDFHHRMGWGKGYLWCTAFNKGVCTNVCRTSGRACCSVRLRRVASKYSIVSVCLSLQFIFMSIWILYYLNKLIFDFHSCPFMSNKWILDIHYQCIRCPTYTYSAKIFKLDALSLGYKKLVSQVEYFTRTITRICLLTKVCNIYNF